MYIQDTSSAILNRTPSLVRYEPVKISGSSAQAVASRNIAISRGFILSLDSVRDV